MLLPRCGCRRLPARAVRCASALADISSSRSRSKRFERTDVLDNCSFHEEEEEENHNGAALLHLH